MCIYHIYISHHISHYIFAFWGDPTLLPNTFKGSSQRGLAFASSWMQSAQVTAIFVGKQMINSAMLVAKHIKTHQNTCVGKEWIKMGAPILLK